MVALYRFFSTSSIIAAMDQLAVNSIITGSYPLLKIKEDDCL